MDYRVMQKMVRGRAFFVENPQLSGFPIGDFRTPGFGGAHRLYTIFEPFYEDNSSGLTNKKEIALEKQAQQKEHEIEKVQQGFGKITKNEIEQHNEFLKRKLTEDIFFKMQHPVYKTTKVKQRRLELEEPRTPLSKTPLAATKSSAVLTESSGVGGGDISTPKKSAAPEKKKKVYCKF